MLFGFNNIPVNYNKSGFTLAETLITLVIIGVIAALTVPSLMNKTNNQETVSRLRKAYSTLSQATNQIISEEGPASNWANNNKDVYNLYKNKLLNVKDCSNSNACLPQGGHYKKLNGDIDTYDVNSAGYYRLINADGIQIIFSDAKASCDISQGGTYNSCAKIYVDVNGSKKPNTMGRDYFGFVLKKNGLYPMGYENDTCLSSGFSCTARVLREGAINY